MKTTSIFNKLILHACKEIRAAEDEYKHQFNLWVQSIPCLSPDYFWRDVETFHSIWSAKKFNVKEATWEYFRQVGEGEQSLAAGVHFAISYRKYVNALREKCENITYGWERGDDSFGDLMDALPMAGQKIYEAVKSGTFFTDVDELVNVSEIHVDVVKARPNSYAQILTGENYLASKLEEFARERMKLMLWRDEE